MKYFIIILAIFLLTACSTKITSTQKQQDNFADCPKDTKECSDGSTVVRISPDCNFAACPVETFVEESKLSLPIADFEKRITKKIFGQYITKENSPVQPERFSGYHTGVDVEYGDVTGDVEVQSISDGTIIISRWVSGYGGVSVIKYNIDKQDYFVLYGHLAPASLLKVNSEVKQGDKIGILGIGGSSETDGERKHLHFAIYKGSSPKLLGYVQTKAELEDWLDPIEFFEQN